MTMNKVRNMAETIFLDISHAIGLLEDVVVSDETSETLGLARQALERARDTMAAGSLDVFSRAEEILKTLRRIHGMTTTDIDKMTPGDAVAMISLIATMASKTGYPIYEQISAIMDKPVDPKVWYIVSKTRDEQNDMPLFWSATDGWGDILYADTFTDHDRVELQLPENGSWVSLPGRPWMSLETPSLQLRHIRKSFEEVSRCFLITTRDEAVWQGQSKALSMLALRLTSAALGEGVDLPSAELLSAIPTDEQWEKISSLMRNRW